MAWIRSRWSARRAAKVWTVEWRECGRIRSEVVGVERAAAEAVLREREAQERSASCATSAAPDGRALVERFLSAMQLAGLTADTLDYYGRRLRAWVAAFPQVPPARWTRAMLEQHLSAHPSWGQRARSIAVKSLRRLAGWAQEAGMVVSDPTKGLRLPRARPKPRTALAPAQVDALLAAADGHRYAPAIALATYAGLSLGDLRTLTWAEVDLEGGWLVRPAGRRKTGQPLRVPLLPRLAEILRAHRPLRPAGLLVCAGLPRKSVRSSYRTLQRLFERAGIPYARGDAWHLLRHSFGTLLMRAGVPTPIIGRLLSHQPGSAVTSLYQHPDDADLVVAMAALGRSLSATGR